jgi:serine protease Do
LVVLFASSPFCRGEYADSFLVLTPHARALADKHYSYCIRNTATYDCPSYDRDGRIAHATRTAISHGTGFAFRSEPGRTLLLTNFHVAEYPSINAGCKRISQSLAIVDNESDRYQPDDIPLTSVVAAPLLDAEVLAAKNAALSVLPWKLGTSAELRERNVVEVRGFPLGVLWAVSDGKVVQLHDHDTDKDRDHDDFISDALLAEGSSGSPVLAVSCRTGEFELVGVHHASYVGAKALNAIVAIDDLRELMTELVVKPRRASIARTTNVAVDDAPIRVPAAINEAFFPFGSLNAAVLPRAGDRLVFALFRKDFPLHIEPVLAIEDQRGALGRVWIGDPDGLGLRELRDVDAETTQQIAALLGGLRHVAIAAGAYREALKDASTSRDAYERAIGRAAALDHAARAEDDLVPIALGLGERFPPVDAAEAMSFRSVLRD